MSPALRSRIGRGLRRGRRAVGPGTAAADAAARPTPVGEQSEPAPFRRILVPIKYGAIADEMAATAILLAAEYGATVEALHVVRVPLDVDLDAAMGTAEREAEEALAHVRRLGERFGVAVTATTTRARALGRTIVDRAAATEADLIVLGSSPRWRRQSRLFSPTVDFVLRHASCEVVIVALPQGVPDDPPAPG